MGIPLSEAVLWDLLVSVNVENAPLLEDENPMVIGTIIDHTSAPVENATIQISSDQNKYETLKRSRAIAFCAVSDSIEEASSLVNNAIDRHVKSTLEYRKDIGSQKSLEKLERIRSELES